MVNAIGTQNVNSVQMFNAINAFRTSGQASKVDEPEVSAGIDINDDDNLIMDKDLNEIKQFAKIVGEDSLSDEDIKYGFTYGRSVIADYSV